MAALGEEAEQAAPSGGGAVPLPGQVLPAGAGTAAGGPHQIPDVPTGRGNDLIWPMFSSSLAIAIAAFVVLYYILVAAPAVVL